MLTILLSIFNHFSFDTQTGLGKESAKQLVAKGAKVYAACRSESKANEAIEVIKAQTGKSDIQWVLQQAVLVLV